MGVGERRRPARRTDARGPARPGSQTSRGHAPRRERSSGRESTRDVLRPALKPRRSRRTRSSRAHARRRGSVSRVDPVGVTQLSDSRRSGLSRRRARDSTPPAAPAAAANSDRTLSAGTPSTPLLLPDRSLPAAPLFPSSRRLHTPLRPSLRPSPPLDSLCLEGVEGPSRPTVGAPTPPSRVLRLHSPSPGTPPPRRSEGTLAQAGTLKPCDGNGPATARWESLESLSSFCL